MLPWGHAAFGYLFYTLYTRLRYRRPPVGTAVYALALGTQLPDLVDKPLAWHLAVLPSGRSLGHSLFTLALVVGGLWYLFDSPERRRLTEAFGVGWFTHLVGDGVVPAVRGDWGDLGYVFWPVTSYPSEVPGREILSFFVHLELTPGLLVGAFMAATVFAIWLYDGAPGVADVIFGRHRYEPEEERV